MEAFFSQQILALISQYGALGMGIGGFLEEIISPIPSSLVQFTGGALIMNSSLLSLSSLLKLFFIVALPSAIGVLIGSLPYYYLSRFGGLYLIEKYGKWIGFDKSKYDAFTARLHTIKHDELLFFILRITPIFPALFVNLYAGFIQMKLPKYITNINSNSLIFNFRL